MNRLYANGAGCVRFMNNSRRQISPVRKNVCHKSTAINNSCLVIVMMFLFDDRTRAEPAHYEESVARPWKVSKYTTTMAVVDIQVPGCLQLTLSICAGGYVSRSHGHHVDRPAHWTDPYNTRTSARVCASPSLYWWSLGCACAPVCVPS